MNLMNHVSGSLHLERTVLHTVTYRVSLGNAGEKSLETSWWAQHRGDFNAGPTNTSEQGWERHQWD